MATLDQIINQLVAAGHPKLPDGHPVASGKPHRYGPNKKYWYSLHEVVKAGEVIGYTGAYGYWSGNDNGAQAFSWEGEALSPEDVAATKARQDAVARDEERKRQQAAKLAANRAREQWHAARDEGESAYLTRKQITAEAVRFAVDGDLYVPMFNYADGYRLVGLQKITPTGAKRFNKGMEKKGASFLLGDIGADDKVAMLAEGYATGRSIRMATDEAIPLLVCFDAGGILQAARYLRGTNPDLHLLICADDDWKIEQRLFDFLKTDFGYTGEFRLGEPAVRIETRHTWYMVRAEYRRDNNNVPYIDLFYGNDVLPERSRRFENTGLKHAYEAARAVGNASVAFPRFTDRGDRKLTDFNDLHCIEGIDPVRQQIQRALLSALMPADEDMPSDVLIQAGIATSVRQGDSVAAPASRGATSAGAAAQEWDGREAENGAHTWEQDLARTEKGNLLPTLGNVHLILSNHKSWHGVIAQDDFAGRVVKRKKPPFPQGELGEWSDMDDIRCVLWLSQKYGISVRQDIVMNAVLLVADAVHFHDVREYLENLVWDHERRVETWPTRYMKVADSEYVRLAGMKWLIAAVARVMRPGCKADNVLILEGKQGWYKSTALEVIAGKHWYTNSPIRIGDKDTYAVMAGKWIIELAELDSLNKSDSSAAKSFFATETDRFRNFYGKRATDVHRQGVFAGSVNFDTYLKDESGNRRYWPLRVGGPIHIDDLRRDRDQLWAEAVHLYRQGVVWHVTESEKQLFENEQAERYEGDVYEDRIARHLDLSGRVTMEEILGDVLKLDTSKWTLPEQRRVGKALKSLGWVRKRETTGKRGWYYVREDDVPVAPPASAADGTDDDAPL
ncbi:virulence protein E [Paraburkholderia sp. Cy-641]|uniref:VapE domain-containing protein n=1 Tax=Paraburkholderia sp. Cy-641 TaxID=2608337 RepID=UPI00141FFCC3|nr:VapE domain-containing protein [Paraburkholderia sp. Cy-641]NIF80152.1 virulence protein E [Paraburkholderia sp. Cy-641]